MHKQKMSSMFHMLGIANNTDNEIVTKVKKSFVSHPKIEGEYVTPVCFNDEQWGVFKKMLARIAKERKMEKKKPPVKRFVTRNHFCEDEMLQYDENKSIVRICTDSFVIVTYPINQR